MRAVQTLEGYYREGSFHTYEPICNVPANVRILITILDDSPTSKRSAWEDFDNFIDKMGEKPNINDFPRCDLSRPLVNFDEV